MSYRPHYFLVAGITVLALVLGSLWLRAFQLDIHDKAINADSLQRLWTYGRQVPLGEVVPAKNRWIPNAFIAEAAPPQPGTSTRVMILDDHYWGSDPSYRSPSGIIGDDISNGLLCSVEGQAVKTGVTIDEVVSRRIRHKCGQTAPSSMRH
jgi:hypothetical protein